MRTTALFAATPWLPNWQSDLNPANKRFRSRFWERTTLSLLAKVEGLPLNVQGDIATRVDKYINLARTARDDATLTRFIEVAAGEREKVAQEARSTANPLWTAAALAEAWCVSRLGLSNGNLNRYSAMSVTSAIEAFAAERAISLQRQMPERDHVLAVEPLADEQRVRWPRRSLPALNNHTAVLERGRTHASPMDLSEKQQRIIKACIVASFSEGK